MKINCKYFINNTCTEGNHNLPCIYELKDPPIEPNCKEYPKKEFEEDNEDE